MSSCEKKPKTITFKDGRNKDRIDQLLEDKKIRALMPERIRGNTSAMVLWAIDKLVSIVNGDKISIVSSDNIQNKAEDRPSLTKKTKDSNILLNSIKDACETTGKSKASSPQVILNAIIPAGKYSFFHSYVTHFLEGKKYEWDSHHIANALLKKLRIIGIINEQAIVII